MSLSAVSDQLGQWATAMGARAARLNDPNSIEAMRKAEEQFKALQEIVRASIVDMEAYKQAAEAKPAKRATAKAPGMDAPEFWRLHGLAVQQIYWRYGSNWKVSAPFGETVLVSLPAQFRSWKNERGVTIKWGRDHRIPAACFWKGERLPDGMVITPDYERAVIWSGYGPPEPKPAAWFRAHGYVWSGCDWKQEMEVRAASIHAQQIEDNREIRRVAALEHGCLTYGPQPASVETYLAEAAD